MPCGVNKRSGVIPLDCPVQSRSLRRLEPPLGGGELLERKLSPVIHYPYYTLDDVQQPPTGSGVVAESSAIKPAYFLKRSDQSVFRSHRDRLGFSCRTSPRELVNSQTGLVLLGFSRVNISRDVNFGQR